MITRFYLFRSNIRELEYYHSYNNLVDFEKNCHDFYMLFPLELLRNNLVDEVVIYRFLNTLKDPIIFKLNSRKFIQKWIKSPLDIFNDQKPQLSFWRGGFQEYDYMISKDQRFFGKKIYLGASKRVKPGNNFYDKVLVESDYDLHHIDKSIPFYKTANQNIFKVIDMKKEFDLCWICNFTQITQKGQEWFIKIISESNELKKLKIIHLGNNPEMGIQLSKKYKISNITFLGWKPRYIINEFLNKSKFGVVTSNSEDGCPRVSTEILMSGTPLLIRDQTRLLSFYDDLGIAKFSNYLEIIDALDNYEIYRSKILKNLNILSIKNICNKNFELWMD